MVDHVEIDDDHSRRIVDLVGRGDVQSRAELAAALALAPSTVGVRVNALIDAGVIVEDGDGDSRGGRRPRILRLSRSAGEVLSVELGGLHARVGRHLLSGELLEARAFAINLADGPVSVLDTVGQALEEAGRGRTIAGIGVGLPGPVETATGSVNQPSRMPGWQGYSVSDHLATRFNVPVVVDNDANLAALGEHHHHFGSSLHSITVKAGSAIGSGIIVDGRVHRGATGAAGDITHTRIDPDASVPCSCGNRGCLETVASGAGVIRQLRERGIAVQSTGEVLERVFDADPITTTLVRTAGSHLGQVLSGVVNFYNPHAVFLTGLLSSAEPFVAAVRSRIYEACHPLATRALTIDETVTGADAVLLGCARLAIDSARIDHRTR